MKPNSKYYVGWFSRQVVSDSCDPMDCSPPGSSVHGISQARILEWLTFPSPGDLPDPRIKPGSPALQADYLANEPQENIIGLSLLGSLDEPQNLQITI